MALDETAEDMVEYAGGKLGDVFGEVSAFKPLSTILYTDAQISGASGIASDRAIWWFYPALNTSDRIRGKSEYCPEIRVNEMLYH
jgi:hypothetical protein